VLQAWKETLQTAETSLPFQTKKQGSEWVKLPSEPYFLRFFVSGESGI
jgi:hypothetical protein